MQHCDYVWKISALNQDFYKILGILAIMVMKYDGGKLSATSIFSKGVVLWK